MPALTGGVSLPVEKAEHIWTWHTNQRFVSPGRLQPKDPASCLLLSGSRKDVVWTRQAEENPPDVLSQSRAENIWVRQPDYALTV